MPRSASIPQRWPWPDASNARRKVTVLPPPSQVPISRITDGFLGASATTEVKTRRSRSLSCPSAWFDIIRGEQLNNSTLVDKRLVQSRKRGDQAQGNSENSSGPRLDRFQGV